jgi:sec-independent protein translocase protein TatB
MFDIGFSELVLIALLALIVLGPKRLPEVARTAGRWLGKLRRFMTDVKQDFDRELRGSELEELRKLKQELNETRRLMEESSSQLYRNISDGLEAGGTNAPTADTSSVSSAAETPAIEAPSVSPEPTPPASEASSSTTRRRSAAKKNGRTRRTKR